MENKIDLYTRRSRGTSTACRNFEHDSAEKGSEWKISWQFCFHFHTQTNERTNKERERHVGCISLTWKSYGITISRVRGVCVCRALGTLFAMMKTSCVSDVQEFDEICIRKICYNFN